VHQQGLVLATPWIATVSESGMWCGDNSEHEEHGDATELDCRICLALAVRLFVGRFPHDII
jgi:hypothetical protein